MHPVVPIEIVAMLAALLSLLAPMLSGNRALKKVGFGLIGLAVVLCLVELLLFPFRWQMVPALVVIAGLLLRFWFDWRPSRVLGWLGLAAGTVLVGLSAVLALGFPVRALPAPDGPYEVGVLDLNRTYTPDHQTYEGSPSRRSLLLKVWYPAASGEAAVGSRQTLWSEFHNPAHFSATERVFAAYLQNMKTHSVQSARLADAVPARPVLIYNHALLSIASETTLLMESLASHGYIIVSIQHESQRHEYQAIQESLSDSERAAETENFLRLAAPDLSRKERSSLSREVYQNNQSLPPIVTARAGDTRHVLDHIAEIMEAVPGCSKEACVEIDRVGLVGLSFGGAVATELCRSEPRCGAIVNMDGGLFGTDIAAPVNVPYLMLYSERNEGGNDFLKAVSGSTFEDRTLKGAEHANYHDASAVLPALRWIGLLGAVDGDRMVRDRNRIVREFLDRAL